MKLTRITVKNFRSYIVGQGDKTPALEVADGLNMLVGPNNCGKSNLLRAVALALDPKRQGEFQPDVDIPKQLSWAYPTVTLSFKCNAATSVEKTLLRYLQDYEKSADAKSTNAATNDVILRVAYTPRGRDACFLARGAGNRRGDPAKLSRAMKQFRKSIRFVYLRSGESLGNFLVGTFRELLHSVIRDHLREEVEKANQRRTEYISGIVQDLLQPLQGQACEQLHEVMEEIAAVSVVPHVPRLNETLARADIWLTDSAETSLLNKGTGVRGAMLVALLSYLVEHSRRSLVLAVEEPESFLHPRAQQELRSDLAQLARRRDVSLLVTTHSPFLLDRSSSTTITPFCKLPDGRTQIRESVLGNHSHVPAISCLFGETITPTVLEKIEPIRTDARAVLFVEGYTDKVYLEKAADLAGKPELLDGLDIRYDEGAQKVVLQALLLRQLVGNDVRMGVLLDWDVPGKSARDMLKKFKWGKSVKTYRDWRKVEPSEVAIEAEDMFPGGFLATFVKNNGETVLSEKVQFRDGTFHFGFTQPGKNLFLEHIDCELKPSHVKLWLTILKDWRKALGL